MFYFSKYVIISSVTSGFNDGWAHSICQPASNLPDKFSLNGCLFAVLVTC